MARGAKKEVAPHVGIPLGPHIEEYLVSPEFDSDGVQVSSGIGPDGKEYPDPVPMAPPVGYVPPSDLMVMMQTMFERGRGVLADAGYETEEEANDFDIEDDPLDPLTEYEKVFMPAESSPAPVVATAPSQTVAQGATEPPPTKASVAPSEPKAGS